MITLLVGYAGLFAGVLLGWLSPEEMRPGKKYFNILQRITFATCIGAGFWAVNLYLGIISLCISLFIPQKLWFYGFLPLLYLLSPYVSYFLFLYGLPSGSQIVAESVRKDKNTKTIGQLFLSALLRTKWFFAAYILIFIFSWIA